MTSTVNDDDWAPVRRLNLNLLYPLDAILHCRTLTEAGNRVHLSQSAMSHALRRLRDHFGDDLVARSGADHYLTPLAQALRPEVRRVMREVEGAFSFAVDFDPATSERTIAIAASDPVGHTLLASLVRKLCTDAPGVIFELLPLDLAGPERALKLGADIAILPGEAASEGLETRYLLDDRLSCLVWSGNPLLGKDRLITPEQYRAGRHVVAIDQADRSGAAELTTRNVAVRVSNPAMIPSIVVDSDLIATGSSWLFQNYASMMPLRVVPAPFESRRTPIVAQWAGHRRGDPMLAWLVNEIEQAAVAATGTMPDHRFES